MIQNSDATFDFLILASRMQKRNDSFVIPEIHLFAYLSCLLWLYRCQAVSDWGYSFVGTEFGAPFCVEIDSAATDLLERGYIQRIDGRFQITELAKQRIEIFTTLEMNFDRLECLNAACSSTSFLSTGMVRHAMLQEPELRRSQDRPSSRKLLEESAISQIYAQFDVLKSAIARPTNDLRLPAVVWLTALKKSTESNYATE